MITMETQFIDIHSHFTPSELLSYGIHPWWFDEERFDYLKELQQLEQLLRENKLAAIGETGIDKLHPKTLPQQIESFKKHILLSETYQKPLIIHNIKGTEILLQLYKEHKPKQAWIIHGFNGNETEVREFVSRGIFLSVGVALLYNNRKITKSIKSISLDYLFFETDTAEIGIEKIYQKAATILNLPLATLKERIFANFARLNLATWKPGTNAPGYSSVTMALRNCERATSW